MDDTVTVWVDGAEIAQLTVPGLPGGSGKPGVRYNQNAGASLYSLSYRTANNLQSLAEDDIVTETSIASTGDNAMKVILDKDFPRVLRAMSWVEKPCRASRLATVSWKSTILV